VNDSNKAKLNHEEIKRILNLGNVYCHSIQLPASQQASQVLSQIRSCGIYGQSDTKGGYLQVLKFPLTILIPPTDPHSLIVLPFGAT
jgi:hypothetical protein